MINGGVPDSPINGETVSALTALTVWARGMLGRDAHK